GWADHRDRLQDRAPAGPHRGAVRPRPAAAPRSRDGTRRRLRRDRAGAGRRAPVLAAEGRRDRRRGAGRGQDRAFRAGDAGARRPAPADRPLRPPRDRLSAPSQARGGVAGRLRPSGAARRMDDGSPTPPGRPPPTAAQRRAADPTRSIRVTASAGTGKTRVLADRVLRLVLAGCAPGQLLCLTFTKAAAAEMVARVQADLGRLATAPEQALQDELAALLGRAPSAEERERARTLLTAVLDLPAG